MLFCTGFSALAQNLVSNGSFETYSSCPTAFSQLSVAVPWLDYNPTCDFMHACSSGLNTVPTNSTGYQMPAHGSGYAGLIAYYPPYPTREYMKQPISPLSVGATYEVSMSVSLADFSKYGSDNLGVWFYDNNVGSGFANVLPVTPHVSYSSYGILTDTQNWIRLVGYFTADSAYDNIVIGGFYPNTSVSSTQVLNTGFYSYYLIDSVVVKIATGINNLYADSVICAGDTFQVPYTVNNATSFVTGNVFSVQLSNPSGSFSSGTITIGTRTANTAGSISCVVPNTVTPGNSYRIRIRSTSIVDSSGANERNISIGVVRPNVSNANNGPVCTSQQLNLYATSTTAGVSYKWAGPAAFSSTIQNPVIGSVTTANSGNYIVTARLYGCFTKDTTTATVVSPPTAIIMATANTPICERDTLYLNATVGTVANSYSWSGPGFSSTNKDTIRANGLISMSGDYIFTAYYTGCSIRDTVTVLVKPLPANLIAGSNSPICSGSNLQLTGSTGSSGVSFIWAGPLSYGSTAQSPTLVGVSPAATGNYILTATLNGCTLKDTVYALVNANPAAPTAGSNSPVCLGQDINLTASTISGATYTWVGPGGYSSTSQNPMRTSATSTMAGAYTVSAIRNGCYSAPTSTIVAVVTAPTVNVYPSPKDSICQGATVTFVATSSNAGSGPIYTWYRNNSPVLTGGTSFPTSAVNDLDEFYVTVTTNGVCATPYTDTSNRITMRVLPWLAPAVTIIANPSITVTSGTMIKFTATPVNGGNTPRYQWTRNGSAIVGATSNIWGASTLSNNDQICVDMTSNYLCPTPSKVKSNCIKVSIESTGITGMWTGKEPSIYPNPVTEKLIIEGIAKGTKIQLYDVIGRVAIKETSVATTTELNMAHLVPGNYVLILSTETGDRMSVKIAKE